MMDMTNMPDSLPALSAEIPDEVGTNWLRMVQWMIFLSLSMMFIPIMLLDNTLSERIVLIEENIATLEAQIDAPPVNPTAQALNMQLSDARNVEGDLRLMGTKLIDRNIEWAPKLQILGNYDPQHIQLMEILQQSDNVLDLTGYARTDTDVILYERQLEDTTEFQSVNLRSVQYQPNEDPEPTRFPIYFQMQLILGKTEQ